MVPLSNLILSSIVAASGALAQEGDPVCIVGAGPAGLSAAKALEDKGRDVVIFEKRDAVGGKSQAVYKDDLFQPLGAVLFNEDSYVETVKLIELTGVPYTDYTPGERWAFDWKSGEAEIIPPAPQEFADLVAVEFQRYSEFWNDVYLPFSEIGYKNGVPAELAVPGAQWLAENGYQAIGIPMIDAFVTYGYGDYREVPMLYMLQFFTPSILANSIGLTHGYVLDFHNLFVEFAKLIEGPIHLNTEIKKITRDEFPTITYQGKGQRRPTTQKCSDLILAFPPTLKALKAAKLTLTAEEEELFGDVVVHNYFSSAVQMNQFPDGTSFWPKKVDPASPVDAEGQPVFFQVIHSGSGVANVWSWDKDGTPDPDKTQKLLVETLSKFNKDPADEDEESQPITDEDIVGFSGVVDYFPHISSGPLAEGWYDRFNELQGKSKTYYASGLSGFEIIEFPLRAGKDIAESYF